MTVPRSKFDEKAKRLAKRRDEENARASKKFQELFKKLGDCEDKVGCATMYFAAGSDRDL